MRFVISNPFLFPKSFEPSLAGTATKSLNRSREAREEDVFFTASGGKTILLCELARSATHSAACKLCDFHSNSLLLQILTKTQLF
jgi:hypothetical protein